ncbi:MAG: hypothetical protein P8L45_06430 [Longimicrobiales bacterium]|nr:hypothetical protein [Longimicrobiales bacterium]
MKNVTLLPVASGSRHRATGFGGRSDSLTYHLGAGDETIPVRRIPDIIEEHHVPPADVMKIDAEGEKAGMLRTAEAALGDHAALLIPVHGREIHAEWGCADPTRLPSSRKL